MEQKNGFLRFYLLVISIVATLGMVISFWFLAYWILDHSLISDEEYIQNNWRYTSCANERYYDKIDEFTQPTENEIATCKEKAKDEIIVERAYSYKNTLISSLTWFFVFVLLFSTHFPFFIKYNREKK